MDRLFTLSRTRCSPTVNVTDLVNVIRFQSTLIKFIVGVASFAVSVVAIIPALIIMSSYRSVSAGTAEG